MNGYASGLTAVVCLLVAAAALAALVAAVVLLGASVRRRDRLEELVVTANALWGALPAGEAVRPGGGPETPWHRRHASQWEALYGARERAAEPVPPSDLSAVQPARPASARPTSSAGPVDRQEDPVAVLDELGLLPAELLDWARRHGPRHVRRAVPPAVRLLEVDLDVRQALGQAGVGAGSGSDAGSPPD